MSSSIPIILCGKSTQVGQSVIMALKPEYEVIHFIQSASRGAAELPHLLKTSAPPPPRTDERDDERNIGSQNYALGPAQAVLLGGGFTDEDIALMRDVCAKEKSGGVRGVPWIRPDLEKATPAFGTREYGLALVGRAKGVLGELREGKVEEDGNGGGEGRWGRDGVYWY